MKRSNFIILVLIIVFKAEVYSQCGYSSLIFHFPDTANGVTINETSTEPTQYSSLFTTDTTTYCGILCGTFQVGYSGAFVQTLTFSNPVNNVVYIVMGSDSVGGGAVESFSFAVNAGTLSCTQVNNSSSSYLYTQQGNLFFANSSPPVNGHSNGAYITLNSTMPYDTIKVYGTGGNAGSFMSLCASSINTTGFNTIKDKSNQVIFYPNPNNGSFVIEPSSQTKQTTQVYDVNGKLVLSQTIEGKTTIDASALNEGIYNISLISREGVLNKRVVIVR